MPLSIDEVIAQGHKRQRRSELVLGVLLLGGGLGWRFGMHVLGGIEVASYGAIGLGAVFVLRGVVGSRTST